MYPHGEYEEVPTFVRLTKWRGSDFKHYKRTSRINYDKPQLKGPGTPLEFISSDLSPIDGGITPPRDKAPINKANKKPWKRASRAKYPPMEYQLLKDGEIKYTFSFILDMTAFFNETKNYFSSRINRGYLDYKGMTIKIFRGKEDITPEQKTPKGSKTPVRIIFPDGSTQEFRKFSDAEQTLNLPRNIIAQRNRGKKESTRVLPGGLRFEIIRELL